MNERAMWVRPEGALGWQGTRYLAVRLHAAESWAWVGFVVRNGPGGGGWRWALTVMRDPHASPPSGTATSMNLAMDFVELVLTASGHPLGAALSGPKPERR